MFKGLILATAVATFAALFIAGVASAQYPEPKGSLVCTTRVNVQVNGTEIYATLLTKSELRDIVEYLGSLRPLGFGGGRGGRGPQATGPAGSAETPPPRALRGLNADAPAAGTGPQNTHP